MYLQNPVLQCLSFKFLSVVFKVMIFREVTSYSLLDRNQHFGETYLLHSENRVKMGVVRSSAISKPIYNVTSQKIIISGLSLLCFELWLVLIPR